MGRPSRDFGDYTVEWKFGDNQITLKPKYPNASRIPPFGLGNALISLNMSDLPERGFTIPITGETSGKGVLPTSPFRLKRWHGLPENMENVSRVLTGHNGWQEIITFPQADGGGVKQVSPTQITQHGFGCENIPLSGRIEW